MEQQQPQMTMAEMTMLNMCRQFDGTMKEIGVQMTKLAEQVKALTDENAELKAKLGATPAADDMA